MVHYFPTESKYILYSLALLTVSTQLCGISMTFLSNMYDATRKNGTFFRVKKVTAFTHIHKEHFTAAFLCHTDKVMIRA